MNKKNKIYTRNIAAEIIEEFENILDKHNICIPDKERTGDENKSCLFGNTYSDLIDNVEYHIKETLKKIKEHPDSEIVTDIFE